MIQQKPSPLPDNNEVNRRMRIHLFTLPEIVEDLILTLGHAILLIAHIKKADKNNQYLPIVNLGETLRDLHKFAKEFLKSIK